MAKVEQRDINRAADFLESWEPGPEMTVDKLARAFAAHREQERAAIVAWLREEARAEDKQSRDVRSPARTAFGAGYLALHRAALAIEQGQHEARG